MLSNLSWEWLKFQLQAVVSCKDHFCQFCSKYNRENISCFMDIVYWPLNFTSSFSRKVFYSRLSDFDVRTGVLSATQLCCTVVWSDLSTQNFSIPPFDLHPEQDMKGALHRDWKCPFNSFSKTFLKQSVICIEVVQKISILYLK